MTIPELEMMHSEIQSELDRTQGMFLRAIVYSRVLARAATKYLQSVPSDKATEGMSPDLAEWMERYTELDALTFEERINETKPRVLQQAMKLLDIYPSIITANDNTPNEKGT